MIRHAIPMALGGLLLCAAPAYGQNTFLPGNESSGIQNRQGNTSPNGGFSDGENNSRIDDYFNQDEQINVDPDTGVLRVLRVNQKNLLNDFVSVVIPLQAADAREVRDIMRTICAMEGGRAEVIRDRETKQDYVQAICPTFMVPYITDAVAALDVDWLELGRDGSRTIHYAPKYRHISTLDPFASRFGGEGVSVLDNLYNTVARRDEPYRAENYIKGAKLFDLPAPHAILEFRIYEVDTSNDLSLGVDWISWKNGAGRGLFEAIFGGQESHHKFDNATGHYDPNLGALTVFNNGSGEVHREATQYLVAANYVLTTAYIDFLRVKGKARVLAEPEVFVLTNQVGSWISVDQTLAFDVQPDSPDAIGIEPVRLNAPTDDGPSDFSAHNRFLNYNIRAELGLELNVFPVIGLDTSEVEFEFISTDLAGTTPTGAPIITRRRIVSKLNLVDGQPFVVGSLSRIEDVKSSNKAPWLGDIPVLGYLFGQENTIARQKEIVVTVTPHFFQGYPKEVTDAVQLETMRMASLDEAPCEYTPSSFCFDKWMYDRVEHPAD